VTPQRRAWACSIAAQTSSTNTTQRHAEANICPERNGRKTLTTVQGLPKKFDQKKILRVIKKKFGTFSASHTLTKTASEKNY
jgi:translation initiation factor 1 (eIF-1/SUI1)